MVKPITFTELLYKAGDRVNIDTQLKPDLAPYFSVGEIMSRGWWTVNGNVYAVRLRRRAALEPSGVVYGEINVTEQALSLISRKIPRNG